MNAIQKIMTAIFCFLLAVFLGYKANKTSKIPITNIVSGGKMVSYTTNEEVKEYLQLMGDLERAGYRGISSLKEEVIQEHQTRQSKIEVLWMGGMFSVLIGLILFVNGVKCYPSEYYG